MGLKRQNIIELNGEQFPIAPIRSQGGLKRDIVRLVNNAPAPDRSCELTDFLMCLQAILDKHLDDGSKAIDRSRTKQAARRLKG